MNKNAMRWASLFWQKLEVKHDQDVWFDVNYTKGKIYGKMLIYQRDIYIYIYINIYTKGEIYGKMGRC